MENEKYYVNIGKAPDLKDRKERRIYRIFEIFPGFLAWATLAGMVIFSWLLPVWTAIFIITFSAYWFLRSLHFAAHLVSAYLRMNRYIKINWIEKLNDLPAREYRTKTKNWKNIYHLVVFPTYKEDYKIIKDSITAVLNADYPKDKMIVVLATEERTGEHSLRIGEQAMRDFGGKFYRFLVTRHPADIVGEIAGKGSNETWGGKAAKKEVIDKEGIPYENIIVSAFDIDTQVYPQYFSCLTYHFTTCQNPEHSSFQPIPLYLNNLWESPFFSRVVSSCNVFWQMMQQQRPEKIVTYSSHSMSFKALVEMNFWQTNVVSEDAGIFWKSFLFFDGNYDIIPLHYPVSMDSCVAKSFWETVMNQYKQQRRWAWGSEGIPYLFFGFLKNKKMPFGKKFRYGFLLIESFWAWSTNAFLLLFLGWLPLAIGGEEFNSTILAYNLPYITRNLMTLAMVGLIACIATSTLLLTPRPSFYPKWQSVSMILQWFLAPLIFILFGAIPALDAQTRLMFGKYMGFWVTEKTRKQ